MMVIGCVKITLKASWVHSLKEKRMIVRSVIAKVRHKFNVSVHEVEAMDEHQTIVLGISCTSNSKQVAQSALDQVINYIEDHFDTGLSDIEMEWF